MHIEYNLYIYKYLLSLWYIAYGPSITRFRTISRCRPPLIALGYIVLRVVWTVAAAGAAGAYIEAIVQHIRYAVHVQILIRGRDLAQSGANDA